MKAGWGLVVVAACAGPRGTPVNDPIVGPPLHATAGDALLGSLPPGAEIVVEVDLARLRANPVVGEMAKALLAAPPAVAGAPPMPLAGADAVVLAAYRVGTPEATTITVVSGGAPPPHAIALDGGRWALALEGEVAAILQAAGDGDDLAGDAGLLAVRGWAMPARAEAASLRITARLEEPARAALAEAFGLDAAPATMSLWGDVADDLAVVVRFGDRRGDGASPRWMPAVVRLRDRLAALPELGALGLAAPVASAELQRHPGGARITVVIAPGRLRRAVQRWASLGAPSS